MLVVPVVVAALVAPTTPQAQAVAEQAFNIEIQAAQQQARQDAREVASHKAEQRRERIAARARAEARRWMDATRPVPGKVLDRWISQAREVMARHGIPGSHAAIRRNIMRESGGNPNAVNNWDINAKNGTPSRGLLQVIKPTFDAYHVEGTPWDQTHPIANIVAACNYAADRYGSIDNVYGAY